VRIPPRAAARRRAEETVMKKLVSMLAVLGLVAVIAAPAAHSGLGGLLDKAKDKVKNRVDRKTDQTMDKGLDAVEGAKKPAAKPAAAAASGSAATTTTAAAGGAEADQLKPGQGAWANYDFKPGSRILFADDFTKDEIGDFPRRLEFKDGAMELVEWQQGRWLRLSNTSHFFVPLPEVLPERYTMEFDCSVPGGEMWIYPDHEKHGQNYIIFGNSGVGGIVGAGGIAAHSNATPELRDKIFHARVMADGAYVKVYVNDKRCVNVPNFGAFRSNKIMFWVDAHEGQPAMFGNFRIAAGGKKLYDALSTDGRVATQGIYFDTGSDRIRPESTPTLKEIAAMLTEHPELKLLIEGHTDNVGAAAANLSLSDKRAAAVRQSLVDNFGVTGDRLTTRGLGATKPVAPNDTPEGRQNNRRVELVKV
jgi:outer membrane protein OmpA-like peptidoglycan-associated protein